jgi:hypothetical protein
MNIKCSSESGKRLKVLRIVALALEEFQASGFCAFAVGILTARWFSWISCMAGNFPAARSEIYQRRNPKGFELPKMVNFKATSVKKLTYIYHYILKYNVINLLFEARGRLRPRQFFCRNALFREYNLMSENGEPGFEFSSSLRS